MSIRIRTRQTLCLVCVILCLPDVSGARADSVKLSSGSMITGTVTSWNGASVVVEVKVGNRTLKRTYPKSRVASITVGGKRIDMATGRISHVAPSVAGRTQRSEPEILADIERLGRTPPVWYETTPLNFPKTLDLSWPQPPPKGWNNQNNVGQYVWDRINPNSGKWREGVRLMHHIMAENDDLETQKRAMRTLGGMYHNLHQDYARSAFWLLQSGLEDERSKYPQAAIQLADCYWQLGSRSMALRALNATPRKPYSAIKLLGDVGETEAALKMAEQFSRTGQAATSFLYAGDACRVGGDLKQATDYYQRTIRAIESLSAEEAGKPHRKRDRARAEASIAAIKFYALDPEQIRDGSYTASSIGYEGQVHVKVDVSRGKIVGVNVTQHREKQYYSSLRDTPEKIVQRQTVAGIDATTGATITSEAIINATATALAQGQ